MSNRIKGYLVGIAFSLAGIVLWVILGALIGIVAGWAAALMGILFFVGYNKFNQQDTSKVPLIVGSILIIVEVFIAELIVLAFIAQENATTINALFSNQEIATGFAIDLIFGFIFGLGIFIGYFISVRRKQTGLQKKMVSTAEQDSAINEIKSEENKSNIDERPSE